jgi:hypothetical protein
MEKRQQWKSKFPFQVPFRGFRGKYKTQLYGEEAAVLDE